MCAFRTQSFGVYELDSHEYTLPQCLSNSPLDLSSVAKTCSQISNIAKKQQLTKNEASDASCWLMKAFRCHRKSEKCADLLETLCAVFKLHPGCCADAFRESFHTNGSIQALLSDRTSLQVIRSSLKCTYMLASSLENYSQISNLVSNDGLANLCKILIPYLFKKRQKDEDEVLHYEIIIYVCRILQLLYAFDNELNCHQSDTIGACKYWMLYGVETDDKTSPSKAMPSQQTVPDLSYDKPRKGGIKIKLRKPRNVRPADGSEEEPEPQNSKNAFKNVEKFAQNSPIVTSESDFSDSESGSQNKLNAAKNKVRLTALNLLNVVIQTSDKHVAFSYWWTLLPDAKPGPLEVSVTQELTSAARRAALTALLSLLTGSRAYLMQADTSKHLTMSFTPFSVALGISLENLHRVLCSQLAKERSIPVLTVVLKCAAALVQATPYQKLGPDPLLCVAAATRRLFEHKDWTVQVQSLIVMGCVISATPPFAKVGDYFTNDNDFVADVERLSIEGATDEKPSSQKPKEDDVGWLIRICFSNLGWEVVDGDIKPSSQSVVPTRLESLQVLSFMALQYFSELIAPHINSIQKVLSKALQDTSTEICLHTAKCVGSIGDAMNKAVQNGDGRIQDFTSFWTNIFHDGLTRLIQSESHTEARVAACDCIGTIGEKIFTRLEEKLQILAATLLLGCCSDENSSVRAGAVRALAVSIMYPQLREDVCLISDCSEMTLSIIVDESPSVKLKASWALANITDALLLNKSDPELESIDGALFIRLLGAALKVSTENDKIKVNAVRAMGNLLSLADESHFDDDPECATIARAAIDRLKQCSSRGSMKVRWNACRALGKCLGNETLYSRVRGWQEDVLDALCRSLESCRNLKVRGHACAALCAPASRPLYGARFVDAWRAVLATLTLSAAGELADFREHRHEEELARRLCAALAHLACLLRAEADLGAIHDALRRGCEAAARALRRVAERAEPQSEPCARLLDAARFVATELRPATDEQRRSADMLRAVFAAAWEGPT